MIWYRRRHISGIELFNNGTRKRCDHRYEENKSIQRPIIIETIANLDEIAGLLSNYGLYWDHAQDLSGIFTRDQKQVKYKFPLNSTKMEKEEICDNYRTIVWYSIKLRLSFRLYWRAIFDSRKAQIGLVSNQDVAYEIIN